MSAVPRDSSVSRQLENDDTRATKGVSVELEGFQAEAAATGERFLKQLTHPSRVKKN